MDERTRVVIADDHPIFRAGLRQVLDSSPEIVLEGEAADGEAALVLIRSRRPEVAVLDLDMPRRDGLAVLRAVNDESLATAVVLLTMHRDEALLDEALNLGVLGYVLKDSAVTEIAGAVAMARRGELFVSPQLSVFLLGRRARRTSLEGKTPGLADLTPSERRTLAFVAAGLSSRQIADRLFVSVRTVDNHRTAAAAKLGLHGPHALLKFALAHRSELSDTNAG